MQHYNYIINIINMKLIALILIKKGLLRQDEMTSHLILLRGDMTHPLRII